MVLYKQTCNNNLHNTCNFNWTEFCFQNWLHQLNLKITWSLTKIKVAIVLRIMLCSKLSLFCLKISRLSRGLFTFHVSFFSVFGLTFGSHSNWEDLNMKSEKPFFRLLKNLWIATRQHGKYQDFFSFIDFLRCRFYLFQVVLKKKEYSRKGCSISLIVWA